MNDDIKKMRDDLIKAAAARLNYTPSLLDMWHYRMPPVVHRDPRRHIFTAAGDYIVEPGLIADEQERSMALTADTPPEDQLPALLAYMLTGRCQFHSISHPPGAYGGYLLRPTTVTVSLLAYAPTPQEMDGLEVAADVLEKEQFDALATMFHRAAQAADPGRKGTGTTDTPNTPHVPLRASTYRPVATGTCPGCGRVADLRFVFNPHGDDTLLCEPCGERIDDQHNEALGNGK